MKWNSYLSLARVHKPVGTFLLWAPTAWALWLANQNSPSFKLIIIFLLGTMVMRAAGCIVNDMADRRFDVHVERTKSRPLATGELSLFAALSAAMVLLLIALLLLLQLPYACFPYAIAALVVTIAYPFCKRFMKAPQLVLGIAFSMGIPMAYVASAKSFDAVFWLLALINFCWIVAYDTEYAMVDRKDDLRIGVQSTAIFFGRWDRLVIALLLMVTHGLWLLLAVIQHFNVCFYIAWFIGLLILMVQHRLLAGRNPKDCFQAFRLNSWYGLMMWFGIIVDRCVFPG